MLAARQVTGADAAVSALSSAKLNNLFVLRLVIADMHVYLVRHCARQHQKRKNFAEYSTPDPGCIVSRNNKMWGVVKLCNALRAVIPTDAEIGYFSSIMNRAVLTAAAIKHELSEDATTPIVILPYCREGGNYLDYFGLDVLNRPGDESVNIVRKRAGTFTDLSLY